MNSSINSQYHRQMSSIRCLSLGSRLFSTMTSPTKKIDAKYFLEMDKSDPTVLRLVIELRRKWAQQSVDELRPIICHPPSPPVLLLPKQCQTKTSNESALAHIMRMY